MKHIFLAAALALAGCTIGDNAADAGADAGNCGTQNCTQTQVCLYRECSAAEKCVPSRQCPAGTTPADCSGQPGCLLSSCAPKLQGCRDIPATCGGDATCACGSICGGAASCAKVDRQNVLCAAPP
jgi:hypothetical protein